MLPTFKELFLEPKFDSIPDDLTQLPWAVWRAEPRENQEGKFNKAPLKPTNTGGYKVGANNPSQFVTFDEAKAAYQSDLYTGVGVLLSKNEIVGIDIDDLDETLTTNKQLSAWLKETLRNNAYCEWSPSKTGLRLFLKGSLNQAGRRKAGPLEIYDDKRFLTVTGHQVSAKELSL